MIPFWQRQLLAAEGYLELGLPARALDALEQIRPTEQNRPEVLAARLNFYLADHDWAAALSQALRLTDLQPENPQWWISYAFATRRHLGLPSAEIILRCAILLHPREGLILYNLSCYTAQSERCREASLLLALALKLQPELEELALTDPDLAPLRAVSPSLIAG